jgi:CRP-like cAMP-binding protein
MVGDRELKAIIETATLAEFKPDDTIIGEGDTATSFYLVLEGQVQITRANRPVAKLGRGQFFGEASLLGDQMRTADVRATRPTKCVVLTGSQLRQLIVSHPEVGLKLVEESIRRYREQGADLQPVRDRITKPQLMGEGTFNFKSQKTRKLFHYLVESFIEDYMKRRLALEASGWRGLLEAARRVNLPRSALYGKQGDLGPAPGELIRRGLAETRIFPGERGRGGEITRVRITYEREPIREYVSALVRLRE